MEADQEINFQEEESSTILLNRGLTSAVKKTTFSNVALQRQVNYV